MKVLSIVWKPTGKWVAFAVAGDNETYHMIYNPESGPDEISGETEGMAHDLLMTLMDYLYLEQYTLSELKKLAELFPIKLQGYVVEDESPLLPLEPLKVWPDDWYPNAPHTPWISPTPYRPTSPYYWDGPICLKTTD